MPPHKVEESQGRDLRQIPRQEQQKRRTLKPREQGCTEKAVTGKDRDLHPCKRRRESWLHSSEGDHSPSISLRVFLTTLHGLAFLPYQANDTQS